MVPNDRPFLGRDLEDFRVRFGYTVDEMCFLCGLTRNRWFMMVNKERDLPIRDVPIALMCRLIDHDQTLNFMPEFISPQELLQTIMKKRDIPLRNFSVLMGNNGTSANRWVRTRKRATPTVYRLATVTSRLIDKVGVDRALDRLRDMVIRESSMRGIRDVFSSGRWTLEDDPNEALRAKGKKADDDE